MAEKGDNSYQNISHASYEISHENEPCCSGHLIVNVFKNNNNFNFLLTNLINR